MRDASALLRKKNITDTTRRCGARHGREDHKACRSGEVGAIGCGGGPRAESVKFGVSEGEECVSWIRTECPSRKYDDGGLMFVITRESGRRGTHARGIHGSIMLYVNS